MLVHLNSDVTCSVCTMHTSISCPFNSCTFGIQLGTKIFHEPQNFELSQRIFLFCKNYHFFSKANIVISQKFKVNIPS
jgi:hypothetical protein